MKALKKLLARLQLKRTLSPSRLDRKKIRADIDKCLVRIYKLNKNK